MSEGLLKRKRQILHRRIAEALCDRFPARADAKAEMVAQHFTRAGLSGLAMEWWSKAGEMALRRVACHEAVSHLSKAIELMDELGEGSGRNLQRLRLHIAYAKAVMLAHSYNAPEVSAAFARAHELAQGVEGAFERYIACYGLWMGAWIRGELRLMEKLAAAFLADVSSRSGTPEAFVAQWLAGMTCWSRGGFTAARTHLERACQLRDPERNRELARHFDVAPGVGALTYLALTLWPPGETEQAERLFGEALALAKSCDDEKIFGYVVLHRSIVKGMRGLLHTDGRDAEARIVLASVLAAFVDTPTLPDIAEARRLLAALSQTVLS